MEWERESWGNKVLHKKSLWCLLVQFEVSALDGNYGEVGAARVEI
jgi:hypothetical protein